MVTWTNAGFEIDLTSNNSYHVSTIVAILVSPSLSVAQRSLSVFWSIHGGGDKLDELCAMKDRRMEAAFCSTYEYQ